MLINGVALTLATPFLISLHRTQVRHLYDHGLERACETGRIGILRGRDGETPSARIACAQSWCRPKSQLADGGREPLCGDAAAGGAAARVHGEAGGAGRVLDVPSRCARDEVAARDGGRRGKGCDGGEENKLGHWGKGDGKGGTVIYIRGGALLACSEKNPV